MTISAPVRVFAVVALLLAAGGMAVLLLAARHAQSTKEPVAPVTHSTAARPHAAQLHVARRQVAALPKLLPGLPPPIRYALLRHHTIVVALNGGRSDAAALAEARTGARLAHTSFLSLDVTREKRAAPIAGFGGTVSDPAVLVVRRPGVVVRRFEGFEDREVVAQAAHDAR